MKCEVTVGVASVVVVPVTPMHEQALAYLAKLEQPDAYAGKVDGVMVVLGSASRLLYTVVCL